MSLNLPFNSWRNMDFIKIDKLKLSKLTFKYQSDSGFVLTKSNMLWNVNDNKADSAEVEKYFNWLTYRNYNDFEDETRPSGEPFCKLTIMLENESSIIVSAWQKGDNGYILQSSLNPTSFFKCGKEGFFNELFPTSSRFSFVNKRKK